MWLLDDVSALERQLMARVTGADASAKLKPIIWSEVGSRVYIPRWTRLVQLNAMGLKGVTPESLGKVAADIKTFGMTLLDPSKKTPNDEDAEGLAIAVAGAALNLLLISAAANWTPRPVTISRSNSGSMR